MGGNALKNTYTRRYEATEYHALVAELHDKLFRRMSKTAVIPAYATKESFGDMDILSTFVPDKEWIKETFHSNEIIRNGDVWSFDYKELQLDWIITPENEFNYAFGYFSQNDVMGNLVGKLAHKFGLKHGHDGLWLPVRDDDQQIGKIRLTLDFDVTLKFLQLPKLPEFGFQTLEEGFEWVASSPYYDPEMYKLENLNTIAKIRDRKRTTYRKFLEFGENWEKSNRVQVHFEKDKTIYLPMIFNVFPDAKQEHERIIGKLLLRRAFREKFNGDIVKELTGLEGKELGKLMEILTKMDFFNPSLIVMTPQERIDQQIVEIFHYNRGINNF